MISAPTARTYYALGRLTSVTAPDGVIVAYSDNDAAGERTRLTHPH